MKPFSESTLFFKSFRLGLDLPVQKMAAQVQERKRGIGREH
jgi:hypothetical protein